MNIELLAPYLGYGLRVQDIENNIFTVAGFLHGKLIADRGAVDDLAQPFSRISTDMQGGEFKPLFRPFCALCDEITVDGKKIVPAVEVAKLAFRIPVSQASEWVAELRPEPLIYLSGPFFHTRYAGGIYDNWNVSGISADSKIIHTHDIFLIHQLLRRLHFAPPGLDASEYIAIGEG